MNTQLQPLYIISYNNFYWYTMCVCVWIVLWIELLNYVVAAGYVWLFFLPLFSFQFEWENNLIAVDKQKCDFQMEHITINSTVMIANHFICVKNILNLYFALSFLQREFFFISPLFFLYFNFVFVLFVSCFGAFSSIYMKATNSTVKVRTLNCPQGFNVILLDYFCVESGEYTIVYVLCVNSNLSVQFSCSYCFVDIISWVWWLHMHTYSRRKKNVFFLTLSFCIEFYFQFFFLSLFAVVCIRI